VSIDLLAFIHHKYNILFGKHLYAFDFLLHKKSKVFTFRLALPFAYLSPAIALSIFS